MFVCVCVCVCVCVRACVRACVCVCVYCSEMNCEFFHTFVCCKCYLIKMYYIIEFINLYFKRERNDKLYCNCLDIIFI